MNVKLKVGTWLDIKIIGFKLCFLDLYWRYHFGTDICRQWIINPPSMTKPNPIEVEAIDENGDYCVDNQELLVVWMIEHLGWEGLPPCREIPLDEKNPPQKANRLNLKNAFRKRKKNTSLICIYIYIYKAPKNCGDPKVRFRFFFVFSPLPWILGWRFLAFVKTQVNSLLTSGISGRIRIRGLRPGGRWNCSMTGELVFFVKHFGIN